MNTKKRLNCYVFSNLIISFLTLNLLTTTSTTNLIKKTSNNVLNKIYEKGNVEVSAVADTFISSEKTSNVIMISNKVVQSGNVLEYVRPSYNSLTGNNLVNYALKFIGLRYVSAGRSLATGTDCSGFTSLIYQEFGITLGPTVASQLYSGTYVAKNDLQPGDLIFYSYGTTASHVALYIGNGQIIHESNPRDGVKISTMNIMNYITARRLITTYVVVSNQKVNEQVVEVVDEVVVPDSNNQEVEEIVNNEEVVVEVNNTEETLITEDNSTDENNNSNELVEEVESVLETNLENSVEVENTDDE
ncbi:MAG: C40 family peptidase [Bacilli bacterium]|nr:C40 family peptidase [Bacilli bacterium]